MAQTRVLIVEDDEHVARETELRLIENGCDVVGIAADGKQALTLVQSLKPDLVLMDIVLPGSLDGIDTATQIRRRWNVPVVYLSASSDDQTLARAQRTEPFGYLVKPYTGHQLRAAIAMALYKHDAERRVASRAPNSAPWKPSGVSRRSAFRPFWTKPFSSSACCNPMAR